MEDRHNDEDDETIGNSWILFTIIIVENHLNFKIFQQHHHFWNVHLFHSKIRRLPHEWSLSTFPWILHIQAWTRAISCHPSYTFIMFDIIKESTARAFAMLITLRGVLKCPINNNNNNNNQDSCFSLFFFISSSRSTDVVHRWNEWCRVWQQRHTMVVHSDQFEGGF